VRTERRLQLLPYVRRRHRRAAEVRVPEGTVAACVGLARCPNPDQPSP
jgi:hypothetical protein